MKETHHPMNQRISEQLFNNTLDQETQETTRFLFSHKQFLFEQYKLLVESAHKIEERRGNSNGFFVSINALFISFLLVNPIQLSEISQNQMILLAFLVIVGITIAWDWLRVINSYRQLNYLNYIMIQALENRLPTFPFSLRGKIEAEQAEQKATSRGNIVLIKENFLPKIFLIVYMAYFISILCLLYGRE